MEYRISHWTRNTRHIEDHEEFVMSPLKRTLIVASDGRISKAFSTEDHRTRLLGDVGQWDLPPELLAESLFAYGYRAECARVLEENPAAIDLVMQFDTTEHGTGLYQNWQRDFVALAQSIRARKEVEKAMLEIKNA